MNFLGRLPAVRLRRDPSVGKSCPYPVTASIYVGLRWHQRFDVDATHPWQIADLDALFRAFFWRNALSSRYDQGFLTQLGTDIAQLKLILKRTVVLRKFRRMGGCGQREA